MESKKVLPTGWLPTGLTYEKEEKISDKEIALRLVECWGRQTRIASKF